MKNDQFKIAVSSLSFSKNEKLRTRLSSISDNIQFNETGSILNEAQLIEFVKDIDILILGTEKLTEKVLSKASRLKLISKYGVGLDNIDFDACEKLGIEVRHRQGVNKLAVAEMTLGFMLSLCRNLYKSSVDLKQGRWLKNGGTQLSGKTVGIIGVGHIGKEVVRLLQPFGCRILVNDIVEQGDYYNANELTYVDKDTLFSESDIVTIHTDLNKETRFMIDSSVFDKMKTSAFFINTARGELVLQLDLKTALLNNIISGAAVDVYETEPVSDLDLLSLSNFYCTPHIGGNSIEAVQSMGKAAIDNLVEFLN
tara:strand:- start:141 stop:1073 length:933 start_codon:yes stop_codon:yes gene_type:complete